MSKTTCGFAAHLSNPKRWFRFRIPHTLSQKEANMIQGMVQEYLRYVVKQSQPKFIKWINNS